MLLAISIALCVLPLGIWMIANPRSAWRIATGRRQEPGKPRRRKPDYFVINFIRIAGFFITAFAVLLMAEMLVKRLASS